MRILDLGCGPGTDLAPWGVTPNDDVSGVDIDEQRLEIARSRFPERRFSRGSGENLPFPDATFDRVIASVSLPYMDIPKALAEIYRTLAPGGAVSLSLHLPGFTLNELFQHALPRPVPTLFRLYVMANGALFHCTGRTATFLNGRTESFQTERGMRVALQRAGFLTPSFRRGPRDSFIVEAHKIGVTPAAQAA